MGNESSSLRNHPNTSSYISDGVNIDFDSYTQLFLDIRNKEWVKQFKYNGKTARYVYFPEVSDDRVYLTFTTDYRQSSRSTSWSFSLVHVIGTSEPAFDTIHPWISKCLKDPKIDQYYSTHYINSVVDAFESTRVYLNKELPVGTTVIWITAENELKEANCDCAIIREVTNKEKDYQCSAAKARVYLIENVEIDIHSENYVEPPNEHQRYKWVSSSDVQSLLTVEEKNQNDSYYRNGMVYFALKYDKSEAQLRNFKNLDRICCRQIFSVIGTGIETYICVYNVGKTKKFGYIIPLYSGRYSIKRFLKNEYNIPLKEWKKNGHISTLNCNIVRHALIYGNDATEKIICTENEDGTEQLAFTLLFQFSYLKISEIDENRARIYGYCHLIQRNENGIIKGKKEKKKRRRRTHNNVEQKSNEEEQSNQEEPLEEAEMINENEDEEILIQL